MPFGYARRQDSKKIRRVCNEKVDPMLLRRELLPQLTENLGISHPSSRAMIQPSDLEVADPQMARPVFM
jgi:hypothetical protein